MYPKGTEVELFCEDLSGKLKGSASQLFWQGAELENKTEADPLTALTEHLE